MVKKPLDPESRALSLSLLLLIMASCRIYGPPWLRIGVLNFDSSTPCEEPARQRESPFYLKGELSETGTDCCFLQSVTGR